MLSEGEQLQHKGLPNWLRKELEELEMKKQREAQRAAQESEMMMMMGEKTTHGSWKEEIEAEEEEEREESLVGGTRATRSPIYRKRSLLDSPNKTVCLVACTCTCTCKCTCTVFLASCNMIFT